MIRISTIFIAICMVPVAASLGLVLYSVAGISLTDSAVVALTALTFLILYNAVSMRLRDRTDVGSQIADLSRGTADLPRQVAEFGRRLPARDGRRPPAVEGRVTSANSIGADRIQAVVGEINELGGLVKQLAASVATHDDQLSSGMLTAAAAPASEAENGRQHDLPPPTAAIGTMAATAAPAAIIAEPAAAPSQAQVLAAIKNAIEENRVDLLLQPLVSLPQRQGGF